MAVLSSVIRVRTPCRQFQRQQVPIVAMRVNVDIEAR